MKEMIWEEMRKKTMQFMFCRERERAIEKIYRVEELLCIMYKKNNFRK